MLGLFVLVHREWGAEASAQMMDKLRPENLSHAFQNIFTFLCQTQLDIFSFFVPFVQTFCRTVDSVYIFKSPSFKSIFVREFTRINFQVNLVSGLQNVKLHSLS